MKVGRAIGVLAAMTVLTVRALARELGNDQRRIWSFPVRAVRNDAWKPALGVIGATAALVALDPIVTPWLQQDAFQRMTAVRRANRLLNARHTAIAINAAWSLFWMGGIVRGNSSAARAGWLAGEAALDAQILAISMKHIDRRMRPVEVGHGGDFTHTWFRTKNRSLDGAGCFPSGHTAAAFAIATVLADCYQYRRGVSFAAYGLAGIVGASRLTTRAHFPSDVFFGACLGYSIGHFVVMEREHR